MGDSDKFYQKYRKKLVIVVAIIVLACLIGSSAYVYFEFFIEEKEIVEEPIEYMLDDRISPLENQGLFVDINRVRHRGLLGELIKPFNNNWRKKPSFYVVTRSEGIEYSTKDIVGPGVATETYFNTWDTMFMEQKNQFNPDEENETSEVEIIVYERVSLGLLGLRKKNVEREKISLIYDYRTGRWSGDDSFGDSDGYGNYLGEYFEVWFSLHQIDYDKDDIPYWTEVNVLLTDPKIDDSKLDPDQDGIPTDWEWYWGYDPFTWDDHENLDPDIDGVENIEEYQMRKWFADPFNQDIYVEVDNMEGRVLLMDRHKMWEESIQAVIERFSRHGINMYIDQGWPDTPLHGGGSILPFYKTTSQDSGIVTQFYKHYFPEERKGIFHYVIIGNEGGFTHPTEDNTYYTSHIYVNNKMYLRMFQTPIMLPTPRAWRVQMAAGFMHEVGHSLGIMPWTVEGCDNHSSFPLFFSKAWREYKNTWGNYYSVMNYFWIVMNDWLKVLVDYSDGSNSDTGYDVNDWETLYLPTFQTVSISVEDITAMPPGYDLVEFELNAKERLEFGLKGWEYDANLTEAFLSMIGGWSPIKPVDVTFRVYRKIDENIYGNYNIKVFGLADVYPTEAEYVLIKQGFIDSDGIIQFYSVDFIIKDVLKRISQQSI